MNVWDGVCMCFIYASLLEFVCVNYVGRKRPLHNVVYRPGENPVTQFCFVTMKYGCDKMKNINVNVAATARCSQQDRHYLGQSLGKPRACSSVVGLLCLSRIWFLFLLQSDKKRDSTTVVTNEIVSCTSCGPNPCTHTANNGCAAEVTTVL
ncbi:neurotransmitter gated ion channel [Holotrichia oblita]|uniref:Neurotransmitter gated ion channel n=1 Tax=Holotrichia oblita TaxID=644536 RepID=A0ACB9SUA8_HOLOL|nr:neurotransmitter gated ion channel [Holotrichia oblita]